MNLACRLLSTLTILTLPAVAMGHSLVICHVGGPGNTEQAKPVLDKFLRHVEQAGGIAKGSMSGEYHTAKESCLKYIDKNKPLFGVFDLATYLQLHRSYKLEPLACMGTMNSQRYHLLVRQGSFKNLKALKGKKLISNLVQDPRFVSRIILGGKIDAAKHFELAHTRRPLKGIRKVARSRAEATLVDGLAYTHLAELKLPVKLVSIYDSPALPGLTLTVLGAQKGAKAKQVIRKMVKALPKLCAGPGKSMCQTFQVTSFTQVKPGSYVGLEKKYD
jgi:hypothetical protein